MDMFEGIEISTETETEVEVELERIIARESGIVADVYSRYNALLSYRNALASVIAEDAVLGSAQYQPRLDRYVCAERLLSAERAIWLADVPGLAEHIAAACDTITKAATS